MLLYFTLDVVQCFEGHAAELADGTDDRRKEERQPNAHNDQIP